MRQIYIALTLALAVSSGMAQMPDSPTGRMAGALVELTRTQDEVVVDEFLAQRAASEADRKGWKRALTGLQEHCPAGQVSGAQKSGPSTARIMISGPGGRECAVSYTIEDQAPHRLVALDVALTGPHYAVDISRTPPTGGGPDERDEPILRFFEAFNSGDADHMQAFYAGAATEDFQKRRTDEEDRELYEMLYGDMGKLEVQSVVTDSPDELQVTTRSERIPDPVRFVFSLEDGKIQGFSVSIGGPPDGEGGGLSLDLPKDVDDKTLAQSVDLALKQLESDGMFSGVVLLARDGRPFFHRAYGLANRDANRPNELDTRFDVGSITKLMTRVAVGQLLQAGKLNLEDSMLKWLPDFPNREAAAKITLHHLLEHRSGLGDIFNEGWDDVPKETLLAPRDFFPLFADQPLRFEPGEGEAYSNAGYIVLGAIVEAASGEPYIDYLDKRIFRPAGMKRSGFPMHDGKSTDLAIGYTRHAGGGMDDAPRPNLGMLPIRGCPAGSSSHTAEDLLKLDRALRAGKLLDPRWTAWVYTHGNPRGDAAKDKVDYPLGVAGGGPGVNAGFESNGATTAIVLANLDPPIAEDLSTQLYRALN